MLEPSVITNYQEQHRKRLHGFSLYSVLGALMLTLLLEALDQTIVGTAMPKIIGQLHGFEKYTWVVTDYLLASTAVIPIAGKLSDQFGRKWFFVIGVVVFLTDSILSGALNMLGLLRTENTILVVLLATFALKLGRRFGDRWILGIAILLNSLGYSVMTFVHSPFILFVAMLFATLGKVLGVPVRQTHLGDIAPKDARSSYVAFNGVSFSGAQLVASFSVILGAYIPSFGMGIICMGLGTLGMVLYQSILTAIHHRRLTGVSMVIST